MSLPLGTYDPGLVVATFFGIPIQGYGDGTFIEVDRSEDAWIPYKGARGDIARARNRDRSGTITITLMATSPTCALLSAIANQDELLGTGVGTVTIKDVLGTTLCSGTAAWVQKHPTITFAKEVETREFVIFCSEIDINQ